MKDKVLILLQENSGSIALPRSVPSSFKPIIYGVIDALAETTENMVRTLQGSIAYKQVILLTDAECTRKKLLDELVKQTKKNRIIDLIILGHGSNESLNLHNETLSGGVDGNIRTLLSDANEMGCSSLNLRMVSMCNCVASSVNDDWLEVGAKVSIGADRKNYMPEPMMTFFIHNWLSGMDAKESAKKAYKATIPFFTLIYRPKIIPLFKNENISYPCGIEGFPPKIRFCTQTISIPDGVRYKPHDYITDSELIVAGATNCTFSTSLN
jgi:hypothetical protein